MTGRKILSGISVISGIPEKAPRDSVILSHCFWTPSQFVELAVKCGYSNKPAANKYVKECNKEEYDTSDFIVLHEKSMRWSNVKTDKGMLAIKNGKTTAFSNGIQGNSSKRQDWV